MFERNRKRKKGASDGIRLAGRGRSNAVGVGPVYSQGEEGYNERSAEAVLMEYSKPGARRASRNEFQGFYKVRTSGVNTLRV
jgi:hypothetical protein